MLIVGCDLTSTPKVCSFFSSAHTRKETADIWCVCKIASYKKHGEEEKSKQRKSFFAMLEITMANILCLTPKENNAKRVFKNISRRVSQKSTIKPNQRRELRNQRIRKPELDAIVISSMAKNDFLRAFFSLLMLFVGFDFEDTPNFCCFFSVAHTEKKQQTFSVPTKTSPTKNRRKGKTQAERSPIFAMFLLPNTSGIGLFSCQCLELLWLCFAVSVIDYLRTQFFLSTVCNRFSIASHKIV